MVQGEVTGNAEGSALLSRTVQQNTKLLNSKRNQKKEDKNCDYCREKEHTRETCFKLHRYSDWYKQLKKDKGASSGKGFVNMASNPFEEGNEMKKESTTMNWSPAMNDFIQQEINKILRGKQM